MCWEEEEMKVEMQAEAEEAIKRLVEAAKEKGELTLSDIERLVRKAGEEVMTALTTRLVEAEAQGGGSMVCPECGGRLRYKGRKARDLMTETGEVRIERGYYYCPSCGTGIFPPGSALGAEWNNLQPGDGAPDGMVERPVTLSTSG